MMLVTIILGKSEQPYGAASESGPEYRLPVMPLRQREIKRPGRSTNAAKNQGDVDGRRPSQTPYSNSDFDL